LAVVLLKSTTDFSLESLTQSRRSDGCKNSDLATRWTIKSSTYIGYVGSLRVALDGVLNDKKQYELKVITLRKSDVYEARP
jgi:hypothetical protein